MQIQFEEMLKFSKALYSKTALLKAAYNFTDVAYIHLDGDEEYYYVSISPKDNCSVVSEKCFINEMLAQSVRHEVYKQTKNIRELLLARAMASSVIINESFDELEVENEKFSEDEILKDWFKE
ncbi:His-Xaa-Ser system protein HxsD [Sporofaciens sp. SGI.106]|uniref:His-Xaa-Ser system protein HxsD n=1 Tax=Sporofaciens sp. SGI.106 TaxID=3420568 RepID=UPI003D071CA5